jgi:hypothetical protein
VRPKSREETPKEGSGRATPIALPQRTIYTASHKNQGRRVRSGGFIRLGCVDGFDEDEGQADGDEGGIVLSRFLTSEGDALEALELADGLLDASASAVERAWEESGPVFCRGFERDDGADAARARRLAIAVAVVALVADGGARRDVRPEVEQDGEVTAVARLAGRQVESDGQAAEIGLEMDLGREAAARAAEGLAVLPPFAPAAETWARAVVESNICTRWAVSLVAASASNMASNTPAWLSRQKRFQTAFHWPKVAGSARQVML